MSRLTSLVDPFGRRISYLRISLTERCDLRCAYCYPRGQREPDTENALSAEDVWRIATAAAGLGIHRLRLTGGEPLLREDLAEIVTRLSALPGVTDLALTTNGQRLAERAAALAEAGLRRVNISLDSLDAEAYRRITGGGDLGAAHRGIEAALAAGLSPVKINVVLTSGDVLGDEGVQAFADLAAARPVHVRFIEAMPTCVSAGYVPAKQVLAALAARHSLAPVPGPEGGGPAKYYRLDASLGTIGVITPLSAPFCEQCNRLRVSARGHLTPCLFSSRGIDLIPALRAKEGWRPLVALFREAAAAKPRRYGDIAEPGGVRAMHVIGG